MVNPPKDGRTEFPLRTLLSDMQTAWDNTTAIKTLLILYTYYRYVRVGDAYYTYTH